MHSFALGHHKALLKRKAACGLGHHKAMAGLKNISIKSKTTRGRYLARCWIADLIEIVKHTPDSKTTSQGKIVSNVETHSFLTAKVPVFEGG
jgi:hypothetical protein